MKILRYSSSYKAGRSFDVDVYYIHACIYLCIYILMYTRKKAWKYMQKINAESWALMANLLNQILPFYKISKWFSSHESLWCTALRNIKESVGHKKFLMKSQQGSLDTFHFLKLRNSVKYPWEVIGIRRSEP